MTTPPLHARQLRTTPSNWCQVLGIERPNLEPVANQRDANVYALLLVALLERGEPVVRLRWG